jgi:hypothetical protein
MNGRNFLLDPLPKIDAEMARRILLLNGIRLLFSPS